MKVLLLTDQRSPEEKAAYAALAKFREMFPEITEAWRRSEQAARYATGGFVRLSEMMPRDNTMLEAIVLDGEVYHTPTGRVVYPEIVKPRDQGKTTFTIRGRIDDIDPAHLEAFYFGTDFGAIERRILETLNRKRNYQMEAYRLAALYGETPAAEPTEPAVKQNGRSAAYLKHDKSKNHRRRRR